MGSGKPLGDGIYWPNNNPVDEIERQTISPSRSNQQNDNIIPNVQHVNCKFLVTKLILFRGIT